MRVTPLLPFVLIVLLLAACGGEPVTDAPASTTGPTEPPAAEAPAEPEVPALAKSVTSSDGVTVNYPDGWLDPAATVGVFLYNNTDGQNIMSFMRGRPGGMAFQIGWQPNNDELSLQDAYTFFFSPLIANMGVTMNEPETFMLGDVEAIKAIGANTAAGSSLGLYTALKPVDDGGFITFVVYLDPSELDAHTTVIEAILAGASHTRP